MNKQRAQLVDRCLGVSALVMAAALAWRVIGPVSDGTAPTFETPAQAAGGMVAQSGAFTLMTSESINEDILLILDGRSEDLTVYRADPVTALSQVQRVSVPALFAEGRQRATGRP